MSAPLAVKQRAAAKAAAKADERLKRVPEHRPPANSEPANSEPAKCGPGRPAKVAASFEQIKSNVEAAHHEHQRLTGQREKVAQSIRAIGHAYHFVDLDRGVRRNGKLIAGDIQAQIDTLRTIAQQEGLSQVCRERIETAERVVPTMQATIECVSGYVRQRVSQLDLTPPASYALHAPRMPSYDLERVASRQTVTAGEPLRALAERRRPPLCAPDGALEELRAVAHHQRKAAAAMLAEVFQRSLANGEGRNGSLSLRNHQLRGLDHPSKRACLTAVHHFFLTRADGTTAAERFFEQKPRSMFTAI